MIVTIVIYARCTTCTCAVWPSNIAEYSTVYSIKNNAVRISKIILSEKLQNHYAIQSLVDFVGQNIGNASDEEIVSIHKQLQCKIEEEMKSCNSLDLTPAASANIGVDISCAAEIA